MTMGASAVQICPLKTGNLAPILMAAYCAGGPDLEDLKQRYPGADLGKPFRRGFERGRNYVQQLCNQSRHSSDQ